LGGPDVNPLPAQTNGFITFGCLNNFCKVNERTLSLWAKILAAIPNSGLLMLCPPGEHRKKIAERLGRVDFLPYQPRMQYLQTYHQIDIGLDTFPYNGHTTSLDSLYMGVPVVSLMGKTVVSRAGFSQTSNLGLAGELVADSEEKFVRLAVELANNFPRLAELRASLRERMRQSPLMDAKRFARDMESAYRLVWKKWCESRP
jgi:predicted O-linked N-acetylglucosamine transferase (SPINDLY family)